MPSRAEKKAAQIIRKAAVEIEIMAAAVQDRVDGMPDDTAGQRVRADKVQEQADMIGDVVGFLLEEAATLELEA